MRISKNISNWLVALVLFALVAPSVLAQGGAAGQQPQSTKGAVIKGKAPVNKEILKVKLPRPQEATLPNGLRVVLLEAHKVPTFNMQMVVLSGGLSDKSDYRGLATATAGLLREGTTNRSSKDIAETVDAIGATLNANSGLSSMTTNISAGGLVENLDQTLELFSDVIKNPTFPGAEVEKYKTRTLAQLRVQRSFPQFLAQEAFNRAIYGSGHPASLVAAPAESIQKLTTKDLSEFHSTHYRPNNAILAIVGDVTMKGIMPKIEKAFGDWKKADVPAYNLPATPTQADAKIYLIDRPGSVQTVIQLGNLGIERTNPDYFAVLMADRVLGGGPSGRLFLNLREDKGYTYGAYSFFSGSKFKGTWGASSEVRTDVTDGAMKEFMYELNRLRDVPVPEGELEDAKRAIVGSFALSLEQPNALLQNVITQKLYNLPADYWDTYPQKVAAITTADVQNAAKKYLDLGRLQVVAVGDAAKAREVLAKYGKVELYDSDGKPVTAPGSENNK